MDEPVPKMLDWVKARAECSIEHLFIVLRAVVEGDTKAANDHVAKGRFLVDMVATDTLLVACNRNRGGMVESVAVAFVRLTDGTISVTRRTARGNTDLFLAKPHVAVNGECKFEVDGAPLEPWQVSRRALEDLFFSV